MWWVEVSNSVQAKTRTDSSFDLIRVSTLSIRHAISCSSFKTFVLNLEELPWQLNLWRIHTDVMYLISPPSVYILLILLLLLLLVHQFAGLCSQQKRMGNICPGDLGAPGPRVRVCPQLPCHPRAGLFYCT
uniref:Uncharacterized protein n=1 Tax=Molossus molossus TaxID=27622 RepID=A0A7J8F8X2_MOLMO|nr:hypothetical protein HJG59_008490 [Molossus molossus]